MLVSRCLLYYHSTLTFPHSSTLPPITTTSLTRRNVSGSLAAARARLVSGPTATIVIVSESFSRSNRRISSLAGTLEASNNACPFESSVAMLLSAAPAVESKSCFHVSAGDR